MTQSQYSLCWEDHPKNICNGLSYLQQNGEFVDMTLAADGHIVKVHQVIIALSSPFLKDLIASANCPHPVIVLNKISHTTLSAILEYIYTGEVLVAIEDIRDLVEAAKDLHIKGLQEMNLSLSKTVNLQKDCEMLSTDANCVNVEEDEISYYEIHKPYDGISRHDLDNVSMIDPECVSLLRPVTDSDSFYTLRRSVDTAVMPPAVLSTIAEIRKTTAATETNTEKANILQYTVSTHGSLQLILNRFLYYLKNTKLDQTRQWRCVDYLTKARCPALVSTKDNMVLQRVQAHKHHFHDKKILKKVMLNNVFSAIDDAERSGLTLNKKPTEDINDSE